MAGAGLGVKFHAGLVAQRALDEAQARAGDSRRQIRVMDKAASDHAAALVGVNRQLGVAYETIAGLRGRACLDAGTVGVLDAIGGEPVRAVAADVASAAKAVASDGVERVATDREVARHIAECRASYAEVSSQLNQILDIEDARQRGKP